MCCDMLPSKLEISNTAPNNSDKTAQPRHVTAPNNGNKPATSPPFSDADKTAMSPSKGSSRRAGRRREAAETWRGGVERGRHTCRPLEFLSTMGGRMAPTVPLITLIVPAVSLMRGSMKPTCSPLWLVYPPHPGGILALHGGIEPPPVLGGIILHFLPFPPLVWGVYPTCGIVDGGQHETHMLPSVKFVYPLLGGYSGVIEGGWCATHTPPPFWFIILLLGDSVFSQQFIEGGPV